MKYFKIHNWEWPLLKIAGRINSREEKRTKAKIQRRTMIRLLLRYLEQRHCSLKSSRRCCNDIGQELL
jgi:hypothetical protein